jgi:hypothetical protein
VQVGRALRDRIVDHQLQQPDDGGICGGDVHLRRVQRVNALLDEVPYVGPIGVAPLDQVADVLRRAARHSDRSIDQAFKLVERDDVEGVGLEDLERVVLEPDRSEHVLSGERLRHERDGVGIGQQTVDRDEGHTSFARQRAGERLLGDEVQGQQDVAEQGSAAALLRERLLELPGADDAVLDQNLSQHVRPGSPCPAASAWPPSNVRPRSGASSRGATPIAR